MLRLVTWVTTGRHPPVARTEGPRRAEHHPMNIDHADKAMRDLADGALRGQHSGDGGWTFAHGPQLDADVTTRMNADLKLLQRSNHARRRISRSPAASPQAAVLVPRLLPVLPDFSDVVLCPRENVPPENAW